VSTPSLYSDGTITVTNGEIAFTGSDTAWSTQLKRGTQISVAGVVGIVAEITGDGAGSFAADWPGESASDAAYVAETWNDGADITEAVRALITRLIGKGLGVVSPGSPVAADYFDNDLVYDRASNIVFIKDMGVLRALMAPGGYDAYGLAEDLGDHNDEPAKFTYFSTDEGGFYVKLSAASADWSSLVLLKGASAADVLTELGVHSITISESEPSGGADNDLWFQVGA
jgi:hypothetical protein